MSTRISKEDLEKVIKKEEYVKLTEKMTACILTTETGFEVIGGFARTLRDLRQRCAGNH